MKSLDLTERHLAILIGPRTNEVFECFMRYGELTAAQVQEKLGFPSKSVYYQVRKLLRAGLLRQVKAGKAASYQPVAKRIRIPDGYQGANYERLAAKRVGARLRKTIRDFEKAAELAPRSPQLVDDLVVMVQRMEISPAALRELRRRLRVLFAEYRNAGGTQKRHSINVLLVVTPDL